MFLVDYVHPEADASYAYDPVTRKILIVLPTARNPTARRYRVYTNCTDNDEMLLDGSSRKSRTKEGAIAQTAQVLTPIHAGVVRNCLLAPRRILLESMVSWLSY